MSNNTLDRDPGFASPRDDLKEKRDAAVEYLQELESYFKRPDMILPDDLTETMIKKFYRLNHTDSILAQMEQVAREHPNEWMLVECRSRNGRVGKVLRKI